MTRRCRDWNEGLAEDLKNPIFSREFVLALLEEGMTLQAALGKVIRTQGLKEFAEKIGMPPSNLVRALRKNYNPSQALLERLLRPFGLRLSAVPAKKHKAA